MSVVGWVGIAALVGLAGPAVRAVVFVHSVPAGEPWRSACPGCGEAVPSAALPASGRCPRCHDRIGAPPGLVEVVTAVALGVLVWRAGAHLATIGLAWAALAAVILALVDLAVHRLPDRIILAALAGTAIAFAVSAAAGGDYRRLGVAVGCAVGCGLVYFLIVFASPRGMGLGDAKLAVLVGLVSGWYGVRAAILALFAGILLAGITAIALLATRRATRTTRIAHGPFMLLGALTAILLVSL